VNLFALEDYDSKLHQPVAGLGVIRPIFLPGAVNAYRFLGAGFDAFGVTSWIVKGWFSGRVINLHEWHVAQYGSPLDTSNYEHGIEFDEVAPEFCVTSWCMIPDPNPGSKEEPEFRAKFAKAYAQTLQEMRRSDVRECAPDEAK
jgi:hypothetical protein